MENLSNGGIKTYELKECVGAGGFGQVYRAHQPSVGREVAVKVILPQHANQPDFIRRFEVEAQLIAHLEHPHIVPLYDYWRDPEGAFLVMRWLKGSLRAAIQRGPWSVEAAGRLLDVVIYEVLVSQKPFPAAPTPVEWINVHLNEPLPHLNMQRPNLPAALNEVLQTATAKDPAQRYPNVLRLAAAFRAAIPAPQRGPAQPLAEPLTERELDILKLMVEGLSNQEIAGKLFLTVGTVKWYVNQIYTKLDVHSRHQAVQRARQLDLIAVSEQASPASTIVVAASSKPEQSAARPVTVPPTDFINPYKRLRAFHE